MPSMISKVDTSAADKALLAKIAATYQQPDEAANDVSAYAKVVVKKPWGYEYLIFANKTIAVWILYLKPDASTSMHCHPSKKTSLVVLEGRVICSTVSERLERSAGKGLLIDRGAFHQTQAVSEAGAYVMEIETPINKRDLVRLKDRYGREGLGYESIDQHSGNTQNYNYVSLDHSAIDYNLKKRFGQCTLTFKRVRGADGLQEILRLNPDDVLCVLKGRLCDERSRTVCEVGDTLTVQDLRAVADLRLPDALELLIIKRIDTVIKISDVVAGFLKTRQIRAIFAVPGEATVHLLDSIGRTEGLNLFCHQGEKAASLAAEGYAKCGTELAVLVVSSGASALNAMAGVGNAWVDSTPLLVLSGQTRTDQYADGGRLRQLDNKSLNIVEIVKPMTKYAVTVKDPATIQYHLEQAAALATSGRPGPVWVDLPINVQGMTVDASELASFVPQPPSPRSPARSRVSEVLDWLRQSRRPVLLAGSGIRIANAEGLFLQLIDALGIPVLTSRRGADLLPEDHPLFFGRPGIYGQRRANFIIQNADLLLSIGSRLSIPLIGRNSRAFARAAKKIVVDIDPHELSKTTILPDLALNMDAHAFITELLDGAAAYEGDHADWIARCRDWTQRFPPLGAGGADPARLMPHRFVSVLADQLQPRDVLVVDGGSPVHKVMQSFKFKTGQRMISSTGLELPGFALAGAIGASISQGGSPVVCLCEDRGFHASVPELQTMMDYRLPIKLFIFKSKGDSNIRKIQRDYFGERYIGTDKEIVFGSPTLCEIARAYGVTAFTLIRPEDMAARIREVLAYPGPAMCEIHVEDDQDVVPRIGFTVKEDGRWIARPLEDMYPYLDRATLKENMLIALLQED